MPKARYAHRDKVKKKSIKSKAKLTSKRKLSRFGKKQKVGHAGIVTDYIARTKAIKKLQITLRDFRRLCILKGIYPRDPKKKPAGSSQTYYHVKDIAYLAYEPLLVKFREFKTYMKRVRKAMNRHEHVQAKQLYDARPLYTLDHLIKERYPSFTDALGDLDDALCMVHLFAALPVNDSIKPERTASARALAREWQYFVARSHSLRKVFLTVKGIYFQADVKGVPVTWLQPWQFAQDLPTDVDYKVMLTFLEFHEVLLRFTHFKLFHSLSLSYPPSIRSTVEMNGGNLAAIDALALKDAPGGSSAGSAAPVAASSSSAAAAAAPALDAASSARLASVQARLKQIARSDGAVGEQEAGGGSGKRSGKALSQQKASASMYDFVDAEAAADAAAGDGGGEGDLEQFAAQSEEAQAVLASSRALSAFQRLFKGLVFFLGREVPFEPFEFMICAFRGRVGWDGPGSPYGPNDSRITHEVVDRPLRQDATDSASSTAGGAAQARREYVQPQWVADCVNARMLLPTAKYARGAVLPPHLSPFVDDGAEGHVPAYRAELDRLRSAAAVTGRLADVIQEQEERRSAAVVAAAQAPGSSAPGAEDDDEEEEEDDDDGEASEDEEDAEEEEEEEPEDGGEEEEEDEAAIEAEIAAAMKAKGGSKKRQREEASSAAAPPSKSRSGAPRSLSEVEAERRALAAAMLSNKQRHVYDRAVAKQAGKQAKVDVLALKAKQAADKGDAGLGVSVDAVKAGAPASSAAGAVPVPAKQAQQQPATKPAGKKGGGGAQPAAAASASGKKQKRK